MSPIIIVSAGALFLLSLSGCCQVFGICTSVAVHTSITPTRSSEYTLSDRSMNTVQLTQMSSSNRFTMALAATESRTHGRGIPERCAGFGRRRRGRAHAGKLQQEPPRASPLRARVK